MRKTILMILIITVVFVGCSVQKVESSVKKLDNLILQGEVGDYYVYTFTDSDNNKFITMISKWSGSWHETPIQLVQIK